MPATLKAYADWKELRITEREAKQQQKLAELQAQWDESARKEKQRQEEAETKRKEEQFKRLLNSKLRDAQEEYDRLSGVIRAVKRRPEKVEDLPQKVIDEARKQVW